MNSNCISTWHKILFMLITAFLLFGLNTPTSFAAVTQQIGFYDTQYININNADCANCHGLNTSDRHHATYSGVNSDCSYCHLNNLGQMEVNRDCVHCHYNSEHHQSSFSVNGQCTICHSPDLVSDTVYDPGVYNPPSPVTPAQCRTCHTGDATAAPPINEVRDLHHDLSTNCQTCHNQDMTLSIRLCEQCHQPNTLHPLHSNSCDGCHSAGNPAQLPPPVHKPEITSLSSVYGLPGDSLIINGSNFGDIQGSVKVGLVDAEVVSWQVYAVTVKVPQLPPDNYYIVVVVNNHGTSNAKTYTIQAGLNTGIIEPTGLPDKIYYDLTEADCRTCHFNTVDRHHATYNADSCTNCHLVVNNEVVMVRDCMVCHTSGPHHNNGLAMGGRCTSCHSNQILSNLNTVPKPITVPDVTAPIPSSCRNCHSTPANSQLHHGTNLDCQMCHPMSETFPIRGCEGCHDIGNTHNIKSHFQPENCVGCHAARPTQFPVLPKGLPKINTLSTNSDGPGSTLTITGLNFGNAFDQGKVYFDVYNAVVLDWTDTTIKVRVPSLPVGNYLVSAENPAGTSNVMEFTITSPGVVKGIVSNASGSPIPGAVITVGLFTVTTDVYGQYTVSGLFEGTYDAQAAKDGYTPQVQKVTVIDNLETNYNFTLQQGASMAHIINTGTYESNPQVSCESCHATDSVNNLTDLIKLHGDQGFACSACHNSTYEGGSTPIIVMNGVMNIPTCSTCHTGVAPYAPKPTAQHDGTTSSHGSASGYGAYNDTASQGADCANCHSQQGTMQVHSALSCNTCHISTIQAVKDAVYNNLSTVTTKPGYTCAECHNSLTTNRNHAPEHQATNDIESKSVTCTKCHSFNLPVMQAAGVTGAHGNCNTCHSSTVQTVKDMVYNGMGKPNPTPYTCNNCHSVLAGQHNKLHTATAYLNSGDGSQCAGCHNSLDVTATHSNVTGQSSNCDKCHVDTVSATVYQVISSNLSTVANRPGFTCESCHSSIAGGGHQHPVGASGYDVAPNVACDTCHATNETTKEADLIQIHQQAGIANFSCSTCHNPTYEGSGNVISGDGVLDLKINGTATIYCSSCHGPKAPAKHSDYVPHGSASGYGPVSTLDGRNCNICHPSLDMDNPHSKLMSANNCNTCHTNANSVITGVIKNNLSTTSRPGYACEDCHTSTSIHTDWQSLHNSTYALVKPWDCSKCHSNYLPTIHPTETLDSCARCHNSTKGKVIAAINSTATDGSNKLCNACHTGTTDGVTAAHTDIATPHLVGIFPTATDATCLNCHTTQAGQFVSSKGAYHVVNGLTSKASGQGRYLSPWTYTSNVGCKGCHGDNKDGKFQASKILKRPYTYTSNSGQADMLCFMCHDRTAYGYGSTSVKSGFSNGSTNYHNVSKHKINNVVQCSWCHSTVPHSTSKAHLIVTQTDPNSTGSKLTNYIHANSGNYQKSNCTGSCSNHGGG